MNKLGFIKNKIRLKVLILMAHKITLFQLSSIISIFYIYDRFLRYFGELVVFFFKNKTNGSYLTYDPINPKLQILCI